MKKSNFYTITFGLLALVGITCAVVLSCITPMYSESSSDMYKIQLSNHYQQAMYNVSECLDNMDSNMSKLVISDSPSMQASLVIKLEGEADAANIALGALPINTSDTMNKATKFVNQTSGYAKSLSKRLANGDKLSANDKQTIKSLQLVSQKLAKSLNDLLSKAEYIDTIDLLTYDVSTGVDFDMIVKFDEGTFDYPKMIYDGPFSDGMEKNVDSKGAKLSKEQAQEKLSQLLDFKDMKSTYIATVTNGIQVYVFDVTKGDQKLRVDITSDGRIAQINGHCGKSGRTISKQRAIEISQNFANKLGYDVSAVWVSKTIDDCIYVNLCPVENNVIMYPDLIKTCVDDNGDIVSFEAYSYLSSHKQRDVNRTLNANAGVSKLDPSFELKNSSVAMVPINDKEILCYEYEVKLNGKQFFVYLDVDTLDEIQILQIISGSEGYTVI